MRRAIKVVCILLAILLLNIFAIISSADSLEYQTWLQTDQRWSSITFGKVGDTIGKSGCAVTSIAKLMVHSGAVSNDSSVFNPGILTTFLNNNGGFTNSGAIYWSSPTQYSSSFVFHNSVELTGSKTDKTNTIKYYTDNGYSIVVQVKYGGHYVAVNQVIDDVVYIFDPASNNIKTLFEYDENGVYWILLYKGPKSHPSTTSENKNNTNPEAQEIPLNNANLKTGKYQITSGNGVNVRSGASTSNSIIGAIGYNEEVIVTEITSDNWGKIKLSNGTTGWICLNWSTQLTHKSFIKGDADENGIVDTADVLLIMQIFVGKVKVSQLDMSLADIDGNGKLETSDALSILLYSVGKTTSL